VTNRKLGIIVGIQAFLIVMLFWVLVFYSKDEYEASSQTVEEEIETPSRVSSKAGMTIINVNAATQQQSGIKTSQLKKATHQAAVSTYGNVISIDSLIDLRTRYLAAKAESAVLRTTLNQFNLEYNRLYALNQDNKNVSDKVVATALANLKQNEAKVYAAETTAKNIVESMLQAWGEKLTKLAMNKDASGLLQSLIAYNAVLIQITLPFDSTEPLANSTITVAPTAATARTIKAQYISRAPQSNTIMQGKTYFYLATTSELRAGMQVKVAGLQAKGQAKGVIIPNTAVIWYGGKPWVYRQTDEAHFSRLPIVTNVEVGDSWFYNGDLQPNDTVVTSGAQLLLSEEFKYQITNENED
jgi:hypothetical protein